jgi:hypothetical protein
MHKTLPFSLVVLLFFCFSCGGNPEIKEEPVEKDSLIIVPPPIIEYGFTLDSFMVFRDTVQDNWTMSHMFAPYGVSQWDINQAADWAADSTVGLRYVKEGTPFIVLCEMGDTSETAQYFIYPKNVVDYVVFDFSDSILVEKRSKPNEIHEQIISGEIIKNSNLTFALDQQLKDINMTG